MSSRRRRGDDDDGEDDPSSGTTRSPRHSRQHSNSSNEPHTPTSDEEGPSEEDLLRQAQLDAAKAELFGPRHAAKSADTSTSSTSPGEGEEAAEEELSADDLLNFDLGELDITTVDMPAELDEVDDDLLQFQSDPLVKEALTKGVDLRNYSAQLEEELGGREQGLLMDYVAHADELAVLHAQVRGCEEILRRMEEMVSQFKGSIGEVSEEIAGMQEKSVAMRVKVDNRVLAQRKLQKFRDAVYIRPEVIDKLNEGAVDDDYADAITTLDRHLQTVGATDYSYAKAMEEVLPQVERTKRTVTQRIRQHLSHRFNDVSACRTSMGVKEEQVSLLPLHSLYTFLINQGIEQTCEDIRQTYIEAVSKVYVSKYKKYWADVRRLMESPGMERGDLLGVEERGKQGLFAKKQTGDGLNRLFTLGDREAVLRIERLREDGVDEAIERDRAAASAVAADAPKRGGLAGMAGGAGGGKIAFERLWRYACDLLVESGINEYDFIVGFFGEKETGKEKEEHERKEKALEDSHHHRRQHSTDERSADGSASSLPRTTNSSSSHTPREELYERGRQRASTHSHDKTIFTLIFQRVGAPFHEALDGYLAVCHDPLSLFLLIRVISSELSFLHALHIYFLDFLFDRMTMTLWPRFKALFDAQVESVKVVPSLIPDGKRSAKEQQQLIASTHYVVSRYGDFVLSILRLNAGYVEDVVTASLKRLRNELDKLITRSTVKLTNGKHQLIFQLITYHAITTKLSQCGYEADDFLWWKSLYSGQLTLFIEEELYERFKQLLSFTKQHQITLQEPTIELPVDWPAVEAIVKHFAKTWREGIEGLSTGVGREFEGASGGMGEEMVRSVLMELLLYYQKFTELLKKYARNQRQGLMRDVVPVNNVVAEIRKYARIQ